MWIMIILFAVFVIQMLDEIGLYIELHDYPYPPAPLQERGIPDLKEINYERQTQTPPTDLAPR